MPSFRLLIPALFALALCGAPMSASAQSFSDTQRGDIETIVRNYLNVCAIYRNEAAHLREWIEFHRIVGAERIFLYDNGSSDEHFEVLAPYLEDGTVVVYDWPSRDRPQEPAYDDCLARHGPESRWIAFIDLDEYLFSPLLQPLPEILREPTHWLMSYFEKFFEPSVAMG